MPGEQKRKGSKKVKGQSSKDTSDLEGSSASGGAPLGVPLLKKLSLKRKKVSYWSRE